MGTATLHFYMGLFNKKKKKAESTLMTNVISQLKKHDKEVANYKRMKLTIDKFITLYKKYLTNSATINGDQLVLHLKEGQRSSFPDGFFAYADKLGLTIEPHCSSGYIYEQRPFTIRAKAK